MKNIKKVTVVAVFALSFSSLAFSQTVFSVVKVPAMSPNSLTAINNAGQVVINTGTSDSYQVSTWNRINGTDNLGAIGVNSGGAAINLSGDVVGAGDPNNSGNLQAFIWHPTGSLTLLGTLGGALSAASGVNDSAGVVGLSYTATNTQHAFLWTQSGGMQDLTPDLTSIGGAAAVAINSSNQVVGYYFPNGSLNTLGFSWTQAGGLQSVGSAGTLAFAVNNAGTIVGKAPAANGYMHAFSKTATGSMKDLGTLGGAESSALSVNNKGWIVGTSLTTSTNGLPHGFLWRPGAGMQDFTVVAGLSTGQQPYSVQINDAGVITLTTNKGGYLLVPKTTATFTSSLNPSRLGQPVTFTATLTSIAGAPPDGEMVQFLVSGRVAGSAPLVGGVAEFTTSAVPKGSHAVVASYLGDVNFLPAKYAAITQVVNP